MEKINQINIFKAFFKIGLILLGGGYVIVPVMQDILIKKRNWISQDELIDFYCVAQCLPGIIAINTSILVGHKLMKTKGAIAALIGLIVSPVISIMLIANFIEFVSKISFIESIFWGVNISVIILIYLTLKEMWQKSMSNIFCYIWFFVILILSILKVNPAVLIISSVLLGILIQKAKDGRCE